MGNLPANRDENWMVVAKTNGMTEASIVAGRLESLGIPVVIQREAASAAFGLIYGPLAEARVLVPEKYYELAMAALEPDDSLLQLDDGEPGDDLDFMDDEEDDDE